jgi:3-methyl-2-oxobutanoate hydroxymethyltransferase
MTKENKMERRYTVRDLAKMKAEGRKITTITAYDAITARLVDQAGFQLILVGDSAGNTVLGYENTIPVTLEESLMLTAAVKRGVKNAMVIGDMPFLSYQVSEEEAVRNAGRYLKETGADGVKLEGGTAMLNTIRRITEASIPVLGHIGLLPQSVLKDGGYRIHGRNEEAQKIIDDALAVQEAGAFAVVLEGVPKLLAKTITETLKIPTIGIGAGPYCDGQIQVVTDILGLGGAFIPRHAKKFANLGQITLDALAEYKKQVEDSTFPAEENSVN